LLYAQTAAKLSARLRFNTQLVSGADRCETLRVSFFFIKIVLKYVWTAGKLSGLFNLDKRLIVCGGPKGSPRLFFLRTRISAIGEDFLPKVRDIRENMRTFAAENRENQSSSDISTQEYGNKNVQLEAGRDGHVAEDGPSSEEAGDVNVYAIRGQQIRLRARGEGR
jgi:hypothetical protein